MKITYIHIDIYTLFNIVCLNYKKTKEFILKTIVINRKGNLGLLVK